MPLVTNKIGQFRFVTLMGQPQAVRDRTLVVARPGIPGVQVINEASRGTPFDLVSAVDCESLEMARFRYLLYCDLIGGEPVNLIHQDWDLWIENGTRVVVLDVEELERRRIHAASGGLNPPSEAWLVCRWILQPVLITEDNPNP